jgi:ribosomal protein S30
VQRKPPMLTQRWRKVRAQTPFLNPKDRLQSQCFQYGINGGQSGTGAVFSEHLCFPLSIINPSKLHLLLSSTTGTIRTFKAEIQNGLSLTSLLQLITNYNRTIHRVEVKYGMSAISSIPRIRNRLSLQIPMATFTGLVNLGSAA